MNLRGFFTVLLLIKTGRRESLPYHLSHILMIMVSSFNRQETEEAEKKSIFSHQRSERLPRGAKLSLAHGQILDFFWNRIP